ncbi:MAG: hypothetical protein WBX01_02335 [Nitrososphaeraceae archaeon]|jgi:hypothetical protein
MKDNRIGKQRIAIGIWSLICIVIMYFIWISSTIQNDVLNAVDKSTTISCGDSWSCEKTVCIDGECNTTKTISSEITDIDEPSAEEDITDQDTIESDNSNSIENLIENRLSMLR